LTLVQPPERVSAVSIRVENGAKPTGFARKGVIY
jgi:hypothetical protein